MTMGYTGDLNAKEAEKRVCLGPCAIEFDSGRQIALADLGYHCLITGATGTGKTSGSASEIVRSAIRAGLPIVIMDIKCNLGDKIRGFAAECGREDAIIEFGSYTSAMPVNILAGKDAHELHEFFLSMLNATVPMDHNRSFHLKGVKYAADCATLLRYMAKADPSYAPTVTRVAEMLANPDLASEMYRKWKVENFDKADEEQLSFSAAIEADRFHTLNRQVHRLGSSFTSSDITMGEQYSYACQALTSALTPLLRSPGFVRNFCSADAAAPDFAAAFTQNKISHIRFRPSCGQAGAVLSRLLLSEAYKALYEIGLDLKRQVLFFADEFQSFCDLSGGRFSDISFVERAREFGGSLVAVTQSVSGLRSRFGASSVFGFCNNMNTEIFLYNSDPATCELAQQHNPDVDLSKLKFGQAFVKSFSIERRAHESGTESVNRAWERCQAVEPLPSPPQEEQPRSPTLAALCASKLGKQDASSKSASIPGQSASRMAYQKDGRAKEHDCPDAFCAGLMRDFPSLFEPGATGHFRVPAGWREYVRHAFELTAELDMQGMINAIYPVRDRLEIRESGPYALPVIHSLIHRCSLLCMRCGKEQATGYGVCESCMETFGIPVPHDEDVETVDEDFVI